MPSMKCYDLFPKDKSCRLSYHTKPYRIRSYHSLLSALLSSVVIFSAYPHDISWHLTTLPLCRIIHGVSHHMTLHSSWSSRLASCHSSSPHPQPKERSVRALRSLVPAPPHRIIPHPLHPLHPRQAAVIIQACQQQYVTLVSLWSAKCLRGWVGVRGWVWYERGWMRCDEGVEPAVRGVM